MKPPFMTIYEACYPVKKAHPDPPKTPPAQRQFGEDENVNPRLQETHAQLLLHVSRNILTIRDRDAIKQDQAHWRKFIENRPRALA